MSEDFFSLYLKYTSQNECPTFFHRWAAVTSLGAFLGRQTYMHHGHFTLYPNLYVMLIGSPGTKKSTGIKIAAKVLKSAGYTTFAAKKTRQEKFLMDLAEQQEKESEQDILDANLFGDDSDIANRAPAECLIAADEFNNFIGLGNLDFMSILGELWDYEGVYDHKLKNSKSIYINNPTISILGGNTPTGFSLAFPHEAIGQGFFSRLLLVYGEPSGVKFTFPPPPDLALQSALIEFMLRIKTEVHGEMQLTPGAIKLVDKIYHNWQGIDDTRFEHYTNRRFTHLLKLTLVFAAARLSTTIEEQDIVYANTLLSFTEHLMPKALGEFGKARHSDVTHRIMTLIYNADHPVSIHEMWKHVHQDLEKREQLIEIIGNLAVAGKIQSVKEGYLPIRTKRAEDTDGTLDWSLLTDSERTLV